MMFSSWITSIAPAFGISSTNLAILLSLIFSLFFSLLGLIATRGYQPAVSGGFPLVVGLVIFTFMEWLPIWTGTALALGIGAPLGYILAKGTGSQ
jgi:hypothetical protein